jgi:hypothetical protein
VSQSNNPYAPPSSLAADGNAPAPVASLELVLLRAWKAFGFWLVGLSLLNGTVSCLFHAELLRKLGDAGAPGLVTRNAILNGPRMAALSACLGAATLVHHLRSRNAKFLWPMFAFTPAAAIVASAIAWFSGTLVTLFMLGSNVVKFLAGARDSVRLFDVGIAFVSSTAYAAVLGPLAMLALPGLVKLVPTRWIRFIVLWLVVAFAIKNIDGFLHPLLGIEAHID